MVGGDEQAPTRMTLSVRVVLKPFDLQGLLTFTLTSMPGNAADLGRKVDRSRSSTVCAAMGEATFKRPMGIMGDSAMLPVDVATAHHGERPLERFGNVPMGSVPATALEEFVHGLRTGEPPIAAKGAATLAGAYDPRIPLYGALPLGLANSLLKDNP